MMRALLLLLAALLCAPARADLVTAQLAYHKADYERAFKDYRELAELGQPVAQYNLAIMYAKGQGVRQSELNAYAWATLAAEGGYAGGKSLAEELRLGLAPGSEKIAEDIRAPFSRAALDARLMPKVEEDADARANCRVLKVADLTYPPDAERNGVQGNVFVEFVVMPDGSTRNPRILYAVPTGAFEPAVRTMVLHLRYKPREPGNKPAHCHVMYRFLIRARSAADYPDLQKFTTVTLKKAEAGDIDAELVYGMLLAGLPQLGHTQSDALPWFLKAAQGGSRSAQYVVGSSLLFGMGCHCEENKGEVWLRRAAVADQSNAQVTLAAYALRGTPDAANTKLAAVWLERAAASGDHDGTYYLSALLAATPLEQMRDPKRALSLLEKVKADVSTDPTVFEIRAAAQAASGAFQDAVSSERRAIAMATKLKWDLAPLNERLAHYESRQPWYGDLLGL
jgi:TonB family protein